LGAGLALFSRFPIIGATVQPYSLNGSPLDVAGGDWFVGKAATSIVVSHPLLGHLEVFNTHVRNAMARYWLVRLTHYGSYTRKAAKVVLNTNVLTDS
jgi:hypothetical protein